MKKEYTTISQRTGWLFAGGYSAAMGAAATGVYAHSVHERSISESIAVGGTIGLLTAATCALLYRRDRRILAREEREQSTDAQQLPALSTASAEIAS